ncbi:MAG: S41 family peptidase [bacterium]
MSAGSSTRALLAAALVLSAGCADTLVGPTASATRAEVFDEVWRGVDLHYSFFEYKQINWDSVGAHYRPLALAAPTDAQFAVVLSQMLRELKDVHVSLTPVGTASTTRYVSSSDTARTYFTMDLVTRQYVVNTRFTTGGHIRYGTAEPTVGYVRISSFAGGSWASEMDEALDRMADVKTIIVDVRDNSGGQYKLAASIAGRFTDRSRTFGYVRYRNGPDHGDFTGYVGETVEPAGPRQFTGRVFVLTNRRDFSSAEDFVLAMRVNPNVSIVGDTTAGASGGPIVRELPNGWTYQVSEWIEYTPERQMFEGIGLVPDVLVPSTFADAGRGIDAALERSIDLATDGALTAKGIAGAAANRRTRP